jgi:hypothetical protein
MDGNTSAAYSAAFKAKVKHLVVQASKASVVLPNLEIAEEHRRTQQSVPRLSAGCKRSVCTMVTSIACIQQGPTCSLLPTGVCQCQPIRGAGAAGRPQGQGWDTQARVQAEWVVVPHTCRLQQPRLPELSIPHPSGPLDDMPLSS